jgi:sporulation protein YlmC with PRC-barrel domain
MGAWFKTDWSYDASRFGLRTTSNLIGTEVAVRGRDAGNIEDLVIDMREGHIAYMLVSLTDSYAGSPNRMAAIPWQAVDLKPDQRLASIDVSREQLLRLAFTGATMPNLEDMTYARRLHEDFNLSPYWEVLGYVAPGGVAKYRGTAWKLDSWYGQAFDPANVTTFSGTIESVSTFKPAPDATAGLRLRIRTDEGKLMLVNAGPAEFATQKGVAFNIGDRITVTGSRAHVAGQNVILASQLKISDLTVQLRTRQGRPLW